MSRRRCMLWGSLLLVLCSAVVEAKPENTRPKAAAAPLPSWPHKKDPPPLVTKHYLDCQLSFKKGKLKVLKVTRHDFKPARAIAPRYRGRFEAHIYSHKAHLDVVRFDFPLTGGTNKLADPLTRQLGQGVTARTRVKVPFDQRVTRVEIRDSLTKARTPVDIKKLRSPPRNLPVPELRTGTFKPRP